jgi:hypothetical protein
MAEPHLAHNVVVLVESRTIDAKRDATATLEGFGNRRKAAFEVKV